MAATATLVACGSDGDLPSYRFHGLCELSEFETGAAHEIAEAESEDVWQVSWDYSEQNIELASIGAYQGALWAAERMICVQKGVIPFEDAAGY